MSLEVLVLSALYLFLTWKLEVQHFAQARAQVGFPPMSTRPERAGATD